LFETPPEKLMVKKWAATAIAMALMGGMVLAAEYEGTIKSIDTAKKTIKVQLKGQDSEKTFTYTKDTKFTGKVGKKGERADLSPESLSKFLQTKGGERRGQPVKFTTKGEGKDEVVTNVKTVGRKKKKSAEE
jgi:hypothetical protein